MGKKSKTSREEETRVEILLMTRDQHSEVARLMFGGYGYIGTAAMVAVRSCPQSYQRIEHIANSILERRDALEAAYDLQFPNEENPYTRIQKEFYEKFGPPPITMH